MGILACGGFASVALSASLAANGIEGAFAAFADFAGQFSCAGAGFLGQFFGRRSTGKASAPVRDSLRRSRGKDIDAACGQLANK